MKIEMIGYNDGKAIAIYSIIKMMPFFLVSFVLSLLALIPTFIFQIYELLLVFLLPGLLLLCMLLQYFINSKDKTFLKGQKIKHTFCLENGTLYKDRKEIKSIKDIKMYKFKKFLFLELKKSYYRIENYNYLIGTRDEFLSQINFLYKHYVSFDLPNKTDDEIINILFGEVSLEGKERLFYSQDKTKIIYIYKNLSGSYSVGYAKMIIAYDEERIYARKYGWWEPVKGMSFASFYGTIKEAYNDIKMEVANYIEFK